MKIKGSGKITNYLQIRDDNFTLVAYFRADKLEKGLKKFSLESYFVQIEAIVNDLKFGEMKYVENL
jgi:hypothetical protein